jgi:hypothetical protein
LTLLDDVSNHLADMPGQTLPVYSFQFPDEPVACVALFPTGGGVGGDIGIGPTYYDAGSAIDYPGVQIQVRQTDPHTAFYLCEEIRKWLDMRPPPGYVKAITGRSQPDDLTADKDLVMSGGPCYRFSVEFSFTKVR